MKATKTLMTIKVEVLSPDCIPSILSAVAERIREENYNGALVASDGDQVTWSSVHKAVEF